MSEQENEGLALVVYTLPHNRTLDGAEPASFVILIPAVEKVC